jgi:hypothetical protein
MMAHIAKVEATFECDGCGKPFKVAVDAARETAGWSVFDYALDAVRAGFGGESVQGSNRDQALCRRCTRIVDSFVTHDDPATEAEIEQALDDNEATQ